MSVIAQADIAAAGGRPEPGGPSIAPVSVASARAAWLAAGHDVARFDAALAPPVAPKPIVDAPKPAAPVFSNKPTSNLSAAQMETAKAALIASGADPAAIDAALAAEGYIAPAQTGRTAEETAMDASAFRAAAPSEFNIDLRGRVPTVPLEKALATKPGQQREMNAAELVRFNADVRGALASMSLPASIGSSLIECALDDSRVYGALDDVGKAQYDKQQRYALGQQLGADRVEDAISNSKALLSIFADANPKLAADFHARGFWNSSRVVLQLNAQAERMFARADMAAKRGRTA